MSSGQSRLELYARAGYDNEDGTLIHKHKWMRWRTFNRLMDRANRASRESDVAALAGLARLGLFSWDDAYASVVGDTDAETTDALTWEAEALTPVGSVDRTEDDSGQG